MLLSCLLFFWFSELSRLRGFEFNLSESCLCFFLVPFLSASLFLFVLRSSFRVLLGVVVSRFSPGVAGSVPILDIGTHTEQIAGKRPNVFSEYPLIAYVRPSCGTAVIQVRHGSSSRADFPVVDFETGELICGVVRSSEARSGDRRRFVIRNFALHNRLAYLVTLTFNDRHLPSSVDGCFAEFRHFLKRLRYQVGSDFPYVAVVERGSLRGRLHLHVGLGRWYFDSGFVSVCSACALPNVSASPVPPGGVCLACVWGNGFVSGPGDQWQGEIRANGDPNRSAAYLSKYVSKEVGSASAPGRNAYRVARGFQPVVRKVSGLDLDGLSARVCSMISPGSPSSVESYAVHEHVERFPGFPTWLLSAGLPLLPAVV